MNKREKKNRIKGINVAQKLAKTYKKIQVAFPNSEYPTDAEVVLSVVRSLSNKHLKIISNNPSKFKSFSPTHLVRMVKDELVDRALELSK